MLRSFDRYRDEQDYEMDDEETKRPCPLNPQFNAAPAQFFHNSAILAQQQWRNANHIGRTLLDAVENQDIGQLLYLLNNKLNEISPGDIALAIRAANEINNSMMGTLISQYATNQAIATNNNIQEAQAIADAQKPLRRKFDRYRDEQDYEMDDDGTKRPCPLNPFVNTPPQFFLNSDNLAQQPLPNSNQVAQALLDAVKNQDTGHLLYLLNNKLNDIPLGCMGLAIRAAEDAKNPTMISLLTQYIGTQAQISSANNVHKNVQAIAVAKKPLSRQFDRFREEQDDDSDTQMEVEMDNGKTKRSCPQNPFNAAASEFFQNADDLAQQQFQNPHQMGQALMDAVNNNDTGQVLYLLNNALNQIPYGYRGWAIDAAVEKNNGPMAFMLTQYVMHDVHPRQIQYAKDKAISIGKPEIAEAIENAQKMCRR